MNVLDREGIFFDQGSSDPVEGSSPPTRHSRHRRDPIFSFAAFYLSAVLRLCPKLGRWVFDAARTAGEAAEGAGRSLEGQGWSAGQVRCRVAKSVFLLF